MIFAHPVLNSFFWIVYVIAVVISAEIYGYLWHRYGGHYGYVPGIKETHTIHHEMDLLSGHEANEDFVWILMLIFTLELILMIGVHLKIIPPLIVIVTILTLSIVFTWNWWIHRAFHDKDHWLNNYSWFQNEKRLHYLHHIYPEKNYGVATHFNDRIFNTWINETEAEKV